MAVIRRATFAYPRQWNPLQVPTWPAEIDWGHSLACGLQFLYIPGVSFADFTNKSLRGTPSGISVSSSSIGPAANFPNAGNVNIADCPATGAALLKDASFFWVGKVVDFSNYRGLFSKTSSSLAAPYDMYFAQSSGLPTLVRGNNTGGGSSTQTVYNATNAPATGVLQTNLWTSPAANNTANCYTNGQLNALSLNFNPGITPQNAAVPLLIGTRADAVTQMSGLTVVCSAYSRMLTAAEAVWLNAEPFAMLRPVVRRSYFIPAPPGATSRPFIIQW